MTASSSASIQAHTRKRLSPIPEDAIAEKDIRIHQLTQDIQKSRLQYIALQSKYHTLSDLYSSLTSRFHKLSAENEKLTTENKKLSASRLFDELARTSAENKRILKENHRLNLQIQLLTLLHSSRASASNASRKP